MWAKLDSFYASVWRQPLRFLCGLTGKDNFFFARNIQIIGVMLQNSTIILLMVFINSLIAILFMGYCFWQNSKRMVYRYVMMKRIEKQFYCNNPAEGLILPLNPKFLHGRPKVMTIAIVASGLAVGIPSTDFLRIIMSIWAVGFLLEAIAGYWLTDIRPPKKTWVRIGIEKFVKAVKRIRIPLPSPSPAPSPAFSPARPRL